MKSNLKSTLSGYVVILALASGCANQNLADNPINRGAGVLASGLAQVNRAVSGGLDSVDRAAMSIQVQRLKPDEYSLAATLGTRRETGPGPNPDTTYRPALDARAKAVCQGDYGLLGERNPQADAALLRWEAQRRPIGTLQPHDVAALSSFPQAGLVWHIRCGHGQAWRAPVATPFLSTAAMSEEERRMLVPVVRTMERVVANVPSLPAPLARAAKVALPTELELKNILLREGIRNDQATVNSFRVATEGLARAIERRNLFERVNVVESTGLSPAEAEVSIYLDGSTLRYWIPGRDAKAVRLNALTYRERVGPIEARGIQPAEAITLALAVLESELAPSLSR